MSIEEKVAESVEEKVEEKVVEEPEMMPVAAHVAYKHKMQERVSSAQIEAAEARGRASAMEAQNVAPPAKSPLDLEMERQAADGIAEDDMSITPKTLRAEQAFQNNLASEAANIESQKALGVTQNASIGTARLVHDDFDAVVKDYSN